MGSFFRWQQYYSRVRKFPLLEDRCWSGLRWSITSLQFPFKCVCVWACVCIYTCTHTCMYAYVFIVLFIWLFCIFKSHKKNWIKIENVVEVIRAKGVIRDEGREWCAELFVFSITYTGQERKKQLEGQVARMWTRGRQGLGLGHWSIPSIQGCAWHKVYTQKVLTEWINVQT